MLLVPGVMDVWLGTYVDLCRLAVVHHGHRTKAIQHCSMADTHTLVNDWYRLGSTCKALNDVLELVLLSRVTMITTQVLAFLYLLLAMSSTEGMCQVSVFVADFVFDL